MNRCLRIIYSVFLFVAFAAPSLGQVHIDGPWTGSDNSYYAPEVDLDEFRNYFRGVLKGYDKYQALANEASKAITDVGPIYIVGDAQGFSELIQNVQFNPLATGGTQDIATGGDYIDQQLGAPNHIFEIANVEVENEVFRQEFGPVQSNRRLSAVGDTSTGEWYEFRFRIAGEAMPFPSAEVFAGNPTARLSVVPEPASAALVLFAAPAIWLWRWGRAI